MAQILVELLSITLPTAAEEMADSARADEIYEGATKAFIAKRRAKATYPLLYNENGLLQLLPDLARDAHRSLSFTHTAAVAAIKGQLVNTQAHDF